MDAISRVIKKILGSNPVLKQGIDDAKILETWPLAVGELLAKHTRAFQVKGKTLLVEVDHPIWKQELHSNKQLALKRLNEKLIQVLELNPEKNEARIEDLFLVSSTPNQSHYAKKK